MALCLCIAIQNQSWADSILITYMLNNRNYFLKQFKSMKCEQKFNYDNKICCDVKIVPESTRVVKTSVVTLQPDLETVGR